jgi:surface carbohydrate biosynthesis protein
MNFFKLLIALSCSQFNFIPPKKKKILIFDVSLIQYFQKSDLFKKKNFEILYTRYEKINLFIIFKCLLNFNLSLKGYYQEYIDYCSPKIFITLCDNNILFYELNCKKGSKISIQSGKRSEVNDIFSNIETISKNKNLSADYIFTFSHSISNLYRKYIKCKTISHGSIMSNSKPIKSFKRSPKKILLISNFYDVYIAPETKKLCRINFASLLKIEIKILKHLNTYLTKRNIKLNILSRYSNNLYKHEKKYYSQIFTNTNFKLLKNSKVNKFQLIDEHSLTIGFDSSLVSEAFGRKKKVLQIDYKSAISSKFDSYRILWPLKKNDSALFYFKYHKNEYLLEKKLDIILNQSKHEWNAAFKKYKKKIMDYDPQNYKLKSLLNNLYEK